ncbi:MAG: hypothetical protein H0X03_00330 [Nitrosopumilus sp.]|nr:hypothetical protein [Nitrosopumilus sp.]
MNPLKLSASILMTILLTLVIFGCIFNQAFAIQLETSIAPSLNEAIASFKGDKIITLKYPENSTISQLLNGKKDSTSFTINSSDPNNGLNQVLSIINNVLLREKQSNVQFENTTLVYRASLNGGLTSSTVSYQVELRPVIINLVTSSNGTDSSILDLDWRSFSTDEPLYVNTTQYGRVDVNHPISGFEKLVPELATKIMNTSFAETFNEPLFDFEEFGVSMENWHFLFDATGAQAGASGFGFDVGVGGSKIISIYSLGESSFREGTHTVKETDSSATIDNVNVNLHSLIAPPSGQMQIGGFSKIQKSGDNEFAFVTNDAPEGLVTSSGSFPITVFLIFGVMMAAVAVLVLVKARK